MSRPSWSLWDLSSHRLQTDPAFILTPSFQFRSNPTLGRPANRPSLPATHRLEPIDENSTTANHEDISPDHVSPDCNGCNQNVFQNRLRLVMCVPSILAATRHDAHLESARSFGSVRNLPPFNQAFVNSFLIQPQRLGYAVSPGGKDQMACR